ncbi:hypothetical protein ACFLVR_04220 [Chloroflexota bacterium]
MARPKIFLSFDYDHDLNLKGHFIHQARQQESPFSMNDFSLSEPYPDREWVRRAQSNIEGCDVFIVLLGRNTHSAPGVLEEVGLARGSNTKRFQLKAHKGPRPPLEGAGEVILWTWENIEDKLRRLMNRG